MADGLILEQDEVVVGQIVSREAIGFGPEQAVPVGGQEPAVELGAGRRLDGRPAPFCKSVDLSGQTSHTRGWVKGKETAAVHRVDPAIATHSQHVDRSSAEPVLSSVADAVRLLDPGDA